MNFKQNLILLGKFWQKNIIQLAQKTPCSEEKKEF